MRAVRLHRLLRTALAVAAAVVPVTAFAQAQGVTLPASGRGAGAGSVTVNPAVPSVQPQGILMGSRAAQEPLTGPLTFAQAVTRGLAFNLGPVTVGHGVAIARAQQSLARSTLLPTVGADLAAVRQQLNLQASGLSSLSSPLPGFRFPSVVGPFTVVDLRARLSQAVVDVTSWQNLKAAREGVTAAERTAEDARDLVVLAVGGTYLQVVAAEARVRSAEAQLRTAEALHRQAVERKAVGLVAQVDVNRSEIQLLTQRQRLVLLGNDVAKQKIALARMIGLPPDGALAVAGTPTLAAPPAADAESGVRAAHEHRADLRSAEAQVRAAERAVAAAKAERLPTVSVGGDYGTLGPSLGDGRTTFSVSGRVHVPVFDGGRTGARVQQAEAAVLQRRAELDDLTGQVDADVRRAALDLATAVSQVELARRAVAVAAEALALTRQRFEAGVTDTVEVVQAQEAVATAELDLINGGFARDLATLALARATGQADEWLGVPAASVVPGAPRP